MKNVNTIKKIPLCELFVDKRYQRTLNTTRVRNIVKGYDETLFGVLIVNKRSEKYAVIDGQHRLEAAKMLFPENKKVPCIVLDMPYEKEAEVFYGMNKMRGPVKALDAFRARLNFGEPVAVDIKRIVEQVGLKISLGKNRPADRTVQCVGTLERIYVRQGPEMLEKVLETIVKAWDGRKESLYQASKLIEGLAMFLNKYQKYPDVYDHTKLIQKLRGVDPVVLKHRAKARAEIDGEGAPLCFAKLILQTYNKNARSKRLPNLFDS